MLSLPSFLDKVAFLFQKIEKFQVKGLPLPYLEGTAPLHFTLHFHFRTLSSPERSFQTILKAELCYNHGLNRIFASIIDQHVVRQNADHNASYFPSQIISCKVKEGKGVYLVRFVHGRA